MGSGGVGRGGRGGAARRCGGAGAVVGSAAVGGEARYGVVAGPEDDTAGRHSGGGAAIRPEKGLRRGRRNLGVERWQPERWRRLQPVEKDVSSGGGGAAARGGKARRAAVVGARAEEAEARRAAPWAEEKDASFAVVVVLPMPLCLLELEPEEATRGGGLSPGVDGEEAESACKGTRPGLTQEVGPAEPPGDGGGDRACSNEAP
ncbi:hypothetical protein ACP70R_026296 [Stipagrostis hirtigluma subsp. patula]